MAEQETMLVRIRPVRKAKAPRVRRYMFEGQRYDADRGWYEVSARTAKKLKKLNQDHYDPESPPIFDVASKEDAVKLEEQEARAAERATAKRPNITDRRIARRQQRNPGTGALTTRDIERQRQARHEDAEMLDPDPDGEELEDEDLSGSKGVNTNLGRISSDFAPVPPDESHDGDKGTHQYVNAKFEKPGKRDNLPPPDESHDGDKGVHAYQNRQTNPESGATAGSLDQPIATTTAGPDDEGTEAIGRKRTRK